jgi:pyruvate/2-oxoacid:ferredoxin oxidoreductase beta subunit
MERSGGDLMQEFKSLKDIPEQDYFTGGSSACAGCGPSLGLKLALKVLGPETIIINSAGCMKKVTRMQVWTYTPVMSLT